MKQPSLEFLVANLQGTVDDGISALATRGRTRAYDGQIAVTFPSLSNRMASAPRVALSLSCCAFVPGRHASWSGLTWREVFDLAERDVIAWIEEALEAGAPVAASCEVSAP